MKIKDTRYTVDYYARTIWDTYYSERKSFDTEAEALAFIQELSENPRVGQVFFTTIKDIGFEKGE